MSIFHRGRIAAVAMVLGASLLVASPAEAYPPGTATAVKVTYNAYTGSWDYHCSYSGWRSGAKVTYHCRLYEYGWFQGSGYAYRLLADHGGSWTPPPSGKTTPTYTEYVAIGHGALCVRAQALSVDGGDDSGIDQKCK